MKARLINYIAVGFSALRERARYGVPILSLALLLSPPVLQAQEAAQDQAEAKQRICTNEDLVKHTFVMVDFSETPPLKQANKYKIFSHAYLTFGENYTYGDLASNKLFTDPKVVAKYTQRVMANGARYALDKEGVLTFIKHDMIAGSYRCLYVLKSTDGFEKGDLIMSGYTRRAKTRLYKVYRRWY